MLNRPQSNILATSGLRTRYFPKSRVGQGVLSAAPWVDILLIAFFFVFLNSRLVLQPGVVVELPRSPFRRGTDARMTAVVLSVRGTDGASSSSMVFFDDERFLIGQENQKRRLRDSFADCLRKHPDVDLVIEADRKVPYGTVVEVMNMALEVGVRRVNLATKP